MKQILLTSILIFIHLTSIAQTIDGIKEGTYITTSLFTESNANVAGQNLGIKGPTLLPLITYYISNGLYAGIGTQLYTDKSITKKALLPEIPFTLGYMYSTDYWETDISITHSQLFYGNKFFRSFLNNDVTVANTYSPTYNWDISCTPTFMFGFKGKYNSALLIENKIQYNYNKTALGKIDALTISPALAYNIGSNKIAATVVSRDTAKSNGKSIALNNSFTTLSIVPSINTTIQLGASEVELNVLLPYAVDNSKNIQAATVTRLQYAWAIPILQVGYTYYLGIGR